MSKMIYKPLTLSQFHDINLAYSYCRLIPNPRPESASIYSPVKGKITKWKFDLKVVKLYSYKYYIAIMFCRHCHLSKCASGSGIPNVAVTIIIEDFNKMAKGSFCFYNLSQSSKIFFPYFWIIRILNVSFKVF
jgi:hypothetical protein